MTTVTERVNASHDHISDPTCSQFLMPGLIDTHIHAPQFPNNGLAMDLPLLEWLQTYTFPTEANFNDTLFAREVYTAVVVGFYFKTSVEAR